MKLFRSIAFFFVSIFFSCSNAWIDKLHQRDQILTQNTEDSIYTVAARPEYEKSKLHQKLFGENIEIYGLSLLGFNPSILKMKGTKS